MMKELRIRWIGLCLLAVLPLLHCAPLHATGSQQIRVVLDDTSSDVRIKGELQWSTASDVIGSSSEPAQLVSSGGKLRLKINGGSYDSARFIARPVKGYVQYGGRGFRGNIELFVGQNGNVIVLNVLPLEQYLYGVVPAEMSPSWPFEALKCQAVAARTYALSRILANMERTYDVYGNVSDQAYKGVSGEHETSNRAVDETAGLVIDYQGQVITAFYSACAGGMTKQGNAPYLRSVSTDHPDSPHHGWEVNMTLEELSAVVKESGAEIGPIKDVTAEYDGNSGHLISIIVHGANDSKQLLGPTLRKLLGRSRMKSTRCRIFPAGQTAQPLVASAPSSQALDTDVVNTATEVRIEAVSYQTEDGNFSTQESFGWLKPWVASADGQRTMKMRYLFAYDGQSMMPCNREMHMLSGLPSAGNSGEVRIAAPAVAAEPMPDMQVVTARLTRAELSNGFVIRGNGYGHGIGMSQWGARQLAEEGMDYAGIIRYFYCGVDIVQWDGAPLMPGDQPDLQYAEEDSEFYESFTSVELGS